MPTNQHAAIIRNLIAPLPIEERQALLAQLLGEQLVQKPSIVAQKTVGKRVRREVKKDVSKIVLARLAMGSGTAQDLARKVYGDTEAASMNSIRSTISRLISLGKVKRIASNMYAQS